MDRLNYLSTVALDQLDTVYQARAKLFQVGLRLTANTDFSAQMAGEFSDLARILSERTDGLRAAFALEDDRSGLLLYVTFRFDDWLDGQRSSAEGGTLLNAVRDADSWLLTRTYSMRPASSDAVDLDAIFRIFTTKTRRELFDDLNAKNRQLEVEIEERKAAEESAMQAQRDLIAKEKLAALGGLVAGIAHEINTPVGIGVTAASHLNEAIRDFTALYEGGGMRRSDLEEFLKSARESNGMVEENLLRASQLIRSFKEVAVDQTADDEREFILRDYAEQVVTSLSPKLRNRAVTISLDGIDPALHLQTAPGPISQILTNLIVNSLVHGFDAEQAGRITIAARNQSGALELSYSDNGKGISPANQAKIFEPFFTTKRSHGGSGLGMHLVYNIVTKKYSGTIRCESELGQGVTFLMHFPGLLGGKA